MTLDTIPQGLTLDQRRELRATARAIDRRTRHIGCGGKLEPVQRHETRAERLIRSLDERNATTETIDRYPDYREGSQLFRCSKCRRTIGVST